MINFEHPYISPHLFVSKGKKYLVPMWIEVPIDTEYKDINWIKPKLEDEKPNNDEWIFKSSSGNGEYRVYKSGYYLRCNCPGYFVSKGKCKHVKEVKAILGEV